MLDEVFTADMPFHVLNDWVEKWDHRATGSVLHHALHEIERKDLAEQFGQELLGPGKYFTDFAFQCL